jgi:hypothetical protein
VAAVATGSIRTGSGIGKAGHVGYCLKGDDTLGLDDLFAPGGGVVRNMAVEAAVPGSVSMSLALNQRSVALDAKLIVLLGGVLNQAGCFLTQIIATAASISIEGIIVGIMAASAVESIPSLPGLQREFAPIAPADRRAVNGSIGSHGMIIPLFHEDVVTRAKQMSSVTGSAQPFDPGKLSARSPRPEKIIGSMMGKMAGTAGVIRYAPGMGTIQRQTGPGYENS